MAPPGHPENRPATPWAEDPGQRQHRTAVVETDGYSLRVNHKKLESGNKNPPPRRVRNQQFGYIERQRKQFLAQGNPIISIDAKKKEMIGNFKNPGTGWEKQPQLVMDHDFRSDAKGMAAPYGIYDPVRNQGFVVVGTSHE